MASTCRAPSSRSSPADLSTQLVERVVNLIQDVTTSRCQAIHARAPRSIGLGRPKPSAPGHASQDRIEGARAQMIAMVAQFLEHPVAVDAVLASVMEDVDLPKGDEKFAHDVVAHARNHSITVLWRVRER